MAKIAARSIKRLLQEIRLLYVCFGILMHCGVGNFGTARFHALFHFFVCERWCCHFYFPSLPVVEISDQEDASCFWKPLCECPFLFRLVPDMLEQLATHQLLAKYTTFPTSGIQKFCILRQIDQHDLHSS